MTVIRQLKQLNCFPDGGVVIFKGNSLKPWYTFQNNCDVSSILAGDIYNQGKNSLLIIGNDGNIHIVEMSVFKVVRYLQPILL